MRKGAIEIGAQRYRETAGRHYEDFVVGDVYEHRPGRTISEADNSWFALLTMNTHPIHFDAEYAARTEFGQLLVCSPLTLAILVGMSVSDVSQKAVANLGWKEIAMTAPVFVGDTLYAESQVLELRESGSRPQQGLVTVKTIGRNQHGTVVCEFIRTALVWKRGHGPADA
ncbi:MaoC family dehydratase [Sphingomonas colocasiae]|uniref:MaoC family dehydratase n=1 Tax=Sphingomonas colocasiae TaxID=1848973 RepID=A0ABS7PUB8_9SPHN|nr:MaoC family dehydratase [Sphingomonas colocasiae]MBY8824265.1 MaoC family dehydratase [Sphingomonas colocasiae]